VTQRRWISLAVIALAFFGVIFMMLFVSDQLLQYGSAHFQLWPKFVFDGVSFPLIGVMLGLFHWQNQRQREGKWKANKAKLVLIGLPAFYFGYYSILVYPNLPLPIGVLNSILLTESSATMFRIVFGYILMTSFYKNGH